MSHWNRAAIVAAVCLLAACTTAPSAESPTTETSAVQLFPADAVVDYQLGGAYPPPAGVTVVTRDSTEQPAAGLYSICYINGFQSQPGVQWPRELILYGSDGEPLIDENWPDENILDISTEAKRTQIAGTLGTAITFCDAKGFQAVEFDNFDSYTRSDGQLTEDDAIALATDLVAQAHRVGLAAGQKNAAELLDRGRQEVGFDFAVVEECDQFQECSTFVDAYGVSVIDIEYDDELRRPFAKFCADAAHPPITVLRDRDLVAEGSPGYVLQHCP